MSAQVKFTAIEDADGRLASKNAGLTDIVILEKGISLDIELRFLELTINATSGSGTHFPSTLFHSNQCLTLFLQC